MSGDDSNLHNDSLKDEINKELIYDKWAQTYEDYVTSLDYKGPGNLANELYDYINLNKIADPTILDFGCGTGLLGKEISLKLANQIFSLDGIDISEEMIRICKSKNIYNNIWKKNLFNESIPKINQYDVIISCGVFLEGHVSFEMINILLNYTKQSGILIFTLRESFKEKNLEEYIKYISLNPRLDIQHECYLEYLPNVKCKMILAKKIY